MIKVNSDLLIWRYRKKYKHKIEWIYCSRNADKEPLIKEEVRIKTLLWARGRDIEARAWYTEEDLEDGYLPGLHSTYAAYVGHEDPNWNDKEFMAEAKAHYEERLEQDW